MSVMNFHGIWYCIRFSLLLINLGFFLYLNPFSSQYVVDLQFIVFFFFCLDIFNYEFSSKSEYVKKKKHSWISLQIRLYCFDLDEWGC